MSQAPITVRTFTLQLKEMHAGFSTENTTVKASYLAILQRKFESQIMFVLYPRIRSGSSEITPSFFGLVILAGLFRYLWAMQILSFPHCGRVFVCNDPIGVVDYQKAQDAFDFAVKYGIVQASTYTRAWNSRAANYNGTYPDGQFQALFHQPIAGVVHALPFIATSNPYLQRIPLEILDSMDSAAITFGFRFYSIAEAATISAGASGQGARAQRVVIQLNNLANSVTDSVIEIYFDRQYFISNTAIPTGARWIDLATLTASSGLSAAGLQQDSHNVITVLHPIPVTLRQMNRACAGSLSIQYQHPLNANGGAWTSGYDTIYLDAKSHALAGIQMRVAGVTEMEVRMYRTDNWAQGTASATATMSRSYALTPLTNIPPMGSGLTHSLHNSMVAYMQSIKQLGYVGASCCGSNMGGFNRPICGQSFNYTGFDDQDETLTFSGEIPQGATSFALLANVKTDNLGGSVQTLNFRINADGFDTLASTTSAAGTVDRWFYATGNLSSFSQPVNGKVNDCDIILESFKSAFTANRTESNLYWDGIASFLLIFF